MGHILGPKSHVSIATLVRLLLAMSMDIWDRACGLFRPIFVVYAVLGQVGKKWCGCPQPLAPLVSPGGGLGPRCCATCASASGDFPPWQSRRTLTRFSTSLQNNTCGRSKDACTEVCPTGAHCGQRPWLCYGSGAAPSRPRRTMRNATRIHTCLQNSPTAFCTPTPNFFPLLDAA